MIKMVYLFSEGNASMRDLLGGKGAGIAEMTDTGVPVPPGFTITTDTCRSYYANGKQFPVGLWDQVREAFTDVEQNAGKRFGDPSNPLLVSVRSGAKFSMPGMMDSVLNLGLNTWTLAGLAKLTNNPQFAADTYRRFVQLFGKIVLGVDGEKFEYVMNEAKGHSRQDTDLSAEELTQITERFKVIIKQDASVDFPEDPFEQLKMAIGAVFNSWMGRRAIDYRRLNKIPDNLGTAVNVQTMVFGNLGNDSATGVAFTRNPATGDPNIYGEYLVNAQGEDVVAGIRTPRPIAELEQEMPEVYTQFGRITKQLEQHYRDIQDIEFTIERSKLWILNSHTGKRTAYASLRLAVDFLDEGLISEKEAIFRVSPDALETCLIPRLPEDLETQPISFGLPASPGVASGKVVFQAETAEKLASKGEKVILVLQETAPEDFTGLVSSEGVLTTRGGMTSHAAVISRGMGKPCVSGASSLRIDHNAGLFYSENNIVKEGDTITIDGHTGRIFLGHIESAENFNDPYFAHFAALLWRTNSVEYIENGIGHLWLLRDIVRDKTLRKTSTFKYLPRREVRREKNDTQKINEYKSFIQPSDSVIHEILSIMNWNLDSDTAEVIWGILHNLTRLIQNASGIGNHHLVLRPLNNPEQSFVKLDAFSEDRASRFQLIGLEFFNIGRFIKNFLPWFCLQWWAVVKLDRDIPRPWYLDKINPKGESIVVGEQNVIGFLLLLDDHQLSVPETRIWYNKFRTREFGWPWYKENDISWIEVIHLMQNIYNDIKIDNSKLFLLRDIGFLTEDLHINLKGKSILKIQTAQDRRHIGFYGKELHYD